MKTHFFDFLTTKLKTIKDKFKSSNRRAKIAFVGSASLLGALLLSFGIYSVSFAGESYRNLSLGELDLSGKTREELVELLTVKAQSFQKKPQSLKYLEEGSDPKQFTVSSEDIGLTFDVEATVDQIYAYGRHHGPLTSFWQQLRSIFVEEEVAAQYTYNENALFEELSKIASDVDVPEKDFSLKYEGSGKFALDEERHSGHRIDKERLKESILKNISNIEVSEIDFSANVYEPKATYENAQKTLSAANKALSYGKLQLKFKEHSFFLDVDTIAGLLATRPSGDGLEIYVDEDRALSQVMAISEAINVEPQDAELTFSGGKVAVFKRSREGRKVDVTKTIINIENAILSRVNEGVSTQSKEVVDIAVEVTAPNINSEQIATLGIDEMVGHGETDFSGSPNNRKHNIEVGAKAINGVLLKPGEEFSTLKTLGKIDASTGYLPELVIKENRTIPEYGGGLCQVSTTLFRAALDSGMEILERDSHKYRVSYYEPPVGMDATIYDPAPDFRFKNNYGSHVLVQAKVRGYKMKVEFYGTKDKRVVTVSEPEVYDFVQPGEPQMIYTDTLAPGEKKRLERSHAGASAKFNYKVERAGKVLQEKTFYSKYVAWPEKWLVGKEKEEPKPEPKSEPKPEVVPKPEPKPEPEEKPDAENQEEVLESAAPSE